MKVNSRCFSLFCEISCGFFCFGLVFKYLRIMAGNVAKWESESSLSEHTSTNLTLLNTFLCNKINSN